jgi:hypothetical protein
VGEKLRRWREYQLKISFSFSSILTWIVIVVLIAAIPFAVAEFIKTGEFYL